jgi:hypothetical protein
MQSKRRGVLDSLVKPGNDSRRLEATNESRRHHRAGFLNFGMKPNSVQLLPDLGDALGEQIVGDLALDRVR